MGELRYSTANADDKHELKVKATIQWLKDINRRKLPIKAGDHVAINSLEVEKAKQEILARAGSLDELEKVTKLQGIPNGWVNFCVPDGFKD